MTSTWNDAYVDAVTFRAHTNADSDTHDDEINTVAKGVSDLINEKCGRHFGKTDAAVVRYFRGRARPYLIIDDLVSATRVDVDNDQDGVYEIALGAPDSAVVVLEPHRAAEDLKPYTMLELLPISTNTTLRVWPHLIRGVKVTGTWGWPAVPDAIIEATILLTRQLRDLEKSGISIQVASLESSIALVPGGLSLLNSLQLQFSRRVPATA